MRARCGMRGNQSEDVGWGAVPVEGTREGSWKEARQSPRKGAPSSEQRGRRARAGRQLGVFASEG